MLRRVLSIFVVAILVGDVAGADSTIDNRNNKEWKVSYESGESWSFPGFGSRTWGAMRLKIVPDGSGGYKATIRLFRVNMNGSYTFLGRKEDFPLPTQGADNGNRKRIAFQSADLQTVGGPMSDPDANPKVRLNGIWQRGRSTGNADSHRMQIKVRKLPTYSKTPLQAPGGGYGNCEDDPDTDVLEEGNDQGDNDTAPTDP